MYNSQFNFPPNFDFKFLLIDLLHSRTKNIEISYRVMNSIDIILEQIGIFIQNVVRVISLELKQYNRYKLGRIRRDVPAELISM